MSETRRYAPGPPRAGDRHPRDEEEDQDQGPTGRDFSPAGSPDPSPAHVEEEVAQPPPPPVEVVRPPPPGQIQQFPTQHQMTKIYVPPKKGKDGKALPKSQQPPWIPPTEDDFRAMQCVDCKVTAWDIMEHLRVCSPKGYDEKRRCLTDASNLTPLPVPRYRERRDNAPLTTKILEKKKESGVVDKDAKIVLTPQVPRMYKTKHIFVPNAESEELNDPLEKHCRFCLVRVKDLLRTVEICRKPKDGDSDNVA